MLYYFLYVSEGRSLTKMDFQDKDKTKRLSLNCLRPDFSKRITNIKNN